MEIVDNDVILQNIYAVLLLMKVVMMSYCESGLPCSVFVMPK